MARQGQLATQFLCNALPESHLWVQLLGSDPVEVRSEGQKLDERVFLQNLFQESKHGQEKFPNLSLGSTQEKTQIECQDYGPNPRVPFHSSPWFERAISEIPVNLNDGFHDELYGALKKRVQWSPLELSNTFPNKFHSLKAERTPSTNNFHLLCCFDERDFSCNNTTWAVSPKLSLQTQSMTNHHLGPLCQPYSCLT